MQDYIRSNKIAYEDTADEFQAKKPARLKADTVIADQFKAYLQDKTTVLELGTGSGQLSKLLCERNLHVDAIEYSPKMAQLAQQTAPDALITVDEFLEHDFAEKTYDGIIGIAFVHLFTAKDAMQVMAKIYSLLNPGGVVMLTTTLHDQTFDDKVRKTNFQTEVYRFRRHYALQDFTDLFTNADFNVVTSDIKADAEVDNKRWVTVVARCN